ncbi:unnamed protein product (macronuclear) [Paramecium tetraurelia]|uniref:Uncharacterized protein n=1 Tax=Paramecium tetraurelia TaxID=5888 RepID=A0C0Y6_PARTE|nr:uncharacterized protein GSPATT00033929001 [Paramecium tetraurelia]CAK64453.1 unnamed protein product [Paramecium tetraurelia]|eukprot:XP_001431851.1 hypothetical protein (macronuclear) [Paramecium tetraurelia strain d4-2]
MKHLSSLIYNPIMFMWLKVMVNANLLLFFAIKLQRVQYFQKVTLHLHFPFVSAKARQSAANFEIKVSSNIGQTHFNLQSIDWQIALFRFVKFSPGYYQTNYYFLNFANSPYSRRELKDYRQLHKVGYNLATYSDGFMQVYSYAAKQFGALKTSLLRDQPTSIITA